MNEQELLQEVLNYIKTDVFNNHLKSIKKNSKLETYKINPLVIKYLSKLLMEEYTPEGVAKALFYPRVLGTSINTIFGSRIQSMFVQLELADAAGEKGHDLIFIDQVDNIEKFCQLKAGPNTINYDDVSPMMKKFENRIRVLRQNGRRNIGNNTCMVGILYGEWVDLSKHYLRINDIYDVIIGRDFWHRITGFENFYNLLIPPLNEIILNLDTQGALEDGCMALTTEIVENWHLFR